MGEKLQNAEIHYNPIDIDRDDYVEYPNIEDNYYIAFPARLLTIHKGQDLLLEVLSQSKWQKRNLVVNFYGVGPDEQKLKQIVKEKNIKNVNFLGHIESMREIWEKNHAFILTSHMEGLPIVLLSAMFAGRVPIVTNVGGNSEVIIDRENGFVSSDVSIESIDETLERAWNRKSEWEDLGKKGKEYINKLYPVNPLKAVLEKINLIASKKKLCIVHIGMPKTGSSTLQENFFHGIDDPRVSYIQNQAGWIHGLFVEHPLDYHFFKNININTLEQFEKYKTNSMQILVNSFLDDSRSIEILSCEDAFHLDEKGVEKLKLFLEPYFRKIIIVGYVRPLKSFLESAFQQLVKYHNQANLDHNTFYHPYKNFKRYDNVFGQDNVKLFKFDPSAFPEGDILLDFCQKMNLKPSKSKVKVVNESISKEAVAILFTYNYHANAKTDFDTKTFMLQLRMVELLSKLGTNKFRFTNQYIANVLNTFHDDYHWIQTRLGDLLDEFTDVEDVSGFSNEWELMDYSTNYIDDLVKLLDNVPIPFELVKHPQTVAKLVDLLMNKIYNDIHSSELINNDNR